jgi:hypothetical protein
VFGYPVSAPLFVRVPGRTHGTRGVNVQNSKDVSDEMTAIDAAGGDPLAGSGFENQEPDPDFAGSEPPQAVRLISSKE